jgi:hypothetical protein
MGKGNVLSNLKGVGKCGAWTALSGFYNMYKKEI